MKTFLFIFICTTANLFAQTDTADSQKLWLHKLPTEFDFKNYPVIRDSSGKYPKQLKVDGVITQVSSTVSCGVLCSSGTMEIKLTKVLKGYSHPFVYLAIPCFVVNPSDYLNKKIAIMVNILEPNNSECYFKSSLNNIDSQGIPFYKPDSEEWIKARDSIK